MVIRRIDTVNGSSSRKSAWCNPGHRARWSRPSRAHSPAPGATGYPLPTGLPKRREKSGERESIVSQDGSLPRSARQRQSHDGVGIGRLDGLGHRVDAVAAGHGLEVEFHHEGAPWEKDFCLHCEASNRGNVKRFEGCPFPWYGVLRAPLTFPLWQGRDYSQRRESGFSLPGDP